MSDGREYHGTLRDDRDDAPYIPETSEPPAEPRGLGRHSILMEGEDPSLADERFWSKCPRR